MKMPRNKCGMESLLLHVFTVGMAKGREISALDFEAEKGKARKAFCEEMSFQYIDGNEEHVPDSGTEKAPQENKDGKNKA